MEDTQKSSSLGNAPDPEDAVWEETSFPGAPDGETEVNLMTASH